jgi:mannosyltransferase OCH1-like enzyme
MIPKKIHYCWFGEKALDALSEKCMASWKQYLPDYELRFWNESSFNIQESPPFVREAYRLKKFAFVSDYVRAWALYNEGGIYLDTDVEIKKNLDRFLQHRAFSGFEAKGFPFTALWAAEAKHAWPEKAVDYYQRQKDFNGTVNTSIVSDLLQNEFGADKNNDAAQNLQEGIVIYPSNYFCVNLPENFATHHFNGSWLKDDKGNKICDFSTLNTYRFYANKAIELRGEKELVKKISLAVLLLEIPKRIVRPLLRLKNKK